MTDQVFNSPEEIMAADLTLKSKEKVYALIICDLLAAETGLPATLHTDKTRASMVRSKHCSAKFISHAVNGTRQNSN